LARFFYLKFSSSGSKWDEKAGAGRREAGSCEFSAENYA
jgi:hypothetical protein